MRSSALRKKYKYDSDELTNMMKKYKHFQKQLLVLYGYRNFVRLCPLNMNGYYSEVWTVDYYKQKEWDLVLIDLKKLHIKNEGGVGRNPT